MKSIADDVAPELHEEAERRELARLLAKYGEGEVTRLQEERDRLAEKLSDLQVTADEVFKQAQDDLRLRQSAEASLAALRSQVQQIAQEMRELVEMPRDISGISEQQVMEWADTLAALTTTGET